MLLQTCSLHSHFYGMLIYLCSKKIQTISKTPLLQSLWTAKHPILATETTYDLAPTDDQIYS